MMLEGGGPLQSVLQYIDNLSHKHLSRAIVTGTPLRYGCACQASAGGPSLGAIIFPVRIRMQGVFRTAKDPFPRFQVEYLAGILCYPLKHESGVGNIPATEL